IILIASLSTQLLLHIMPTMIHASAAQNYELKHPLLTNLDKAGFFDRALYDIIVVRQKIKNLVYGNYVWNGYQIALKTSQGQQVNVILRRPELIYGATFVILPIDSADLASLVTS